MAIGTRRRIMTNERKTTTANSTYPKGGVSWSTFTFVQGSTSVILLNFCAKNPPLRQAANRYLKHSL